VSGKTKAFVYMMRPVWRCMKGTLSLIGLSFKRAPPSSKSLHAIFLLNSLLYLFLYHHCISFLFNCIIFYELHLVELQLPETELNWIKTISDVQSYTNVTAVGIIYNDYLYRLFASLVKVCMSLLISYINDSLVKSIEDLHDIFNSA